MNTKISNAPALRVSRTLKAPPERVYAAWTAPAEILKWFGPETCRTLSAKVDLRVGGEYHFRVKAQEFGELDLRGVYREIEAPARLVYTWNWSGNPALEFDETLVTVSFSDKEGFTEVQLTHHGLPTAEMREDHNHGWNGCLDKLEKVLASGTADSQACPAPGTFCWNELLTSDTGAAAAFYGQLFGWKAATFPGEMKYSIFKQDGRDVGGLMQRPSDQCPPHWLAYVKVESVDATAGKAAELGARVILPAMDIPTVGRIAVFQDPQGVALGIFQPANESSSEQP